MSGNVQIAIDGPAGAGKSTVAKLVAEKLDFLYVDTGAMYRAITWKALQKGIDIKDTEAVAKLAADTRIDLIKKPESNGLTVLCDGKDVTSAIRSPQVSQAVSLLAQVEAVRNILVKKQREIAQSESVVMDGRDIGSHVLPYAPYKFFLNASLRERAKRRYKELCSKGYEVDIKQLEKDIALRDEMDSNREIAPLIKVPEAIEIDTTELTPEQVADKIVEYIKKNN